MTNFEDQNLPPELGDVAKQLRDNRHEASPLELDRAKQRIMKRAGGSRGRRLRWLHRPAIVTAAIVAVAVGGGTAAAFTLSSHKLHTAKLHHHVTAVVKVPNTTSKAAVPAASNILGAVNNLGGGGIFGGSFFHPHPPSAQAFQYFIARLEQLIFGFIGTLLGLI